MSLRIETKKISLLILSIIIILFSLHLILQVTAFFFSNSIFLKIVKLFHLDEEANIPTYFSSILFIISSLLFFTLSKIESSQNSKYWMILSLVFIFLSLEDFIQLHEQFTTIIYKRYNTSGLLRFIWIYPAFIIVMLVFFFFRKFFFRLPSKFRLNLIIAAIIFFTGTFILELIGGIIISHQGKSKLFHLIASIEELLEFIGLWFLINTLLNYISSIRTDFQIYLVKPNK